MLIETKALGRELPALNALDTNALCELSASLGFPVDGVEIREGATILDVDITANRGDVQSHRGFARDLAARFGQELAPLTWTALAEGESLFPVRLEASAAGPLYATAILELGAAQDTPEEVRAFLTAMGASAKGLAAVDASNELLHRYGHPTHAFDADRLCGAVVVRWARGGEKLVTLDGVERTLSDADLVIADESGPIALAGVMGGDGSKVTAETRRVLLESAYFDPRTVRAMARRHNLHTDASHRFGRGADPAMARVARDLLVQRLQEWAGASLVGAWTAGEVPAAAAPILLEKARLDRIAGEPVELGEAAVQLERLGCRVEVRDQVIAAVPPTWRHDLAMSEDLAEEVLRLRGYDRLPMALPPLDGHPEPLSPDYLQRRTLARRLANLGFFQTVTLGFISPEADAIHQQAFGDGTNPAEGRTLGNPLGQEYSVMRSSLIPSLRAVAEYNLRQGAKEVRLFELAPVFRGTPAGPGEASSLALVWGGQMGGESYLSPARSVRPADLVGIAKALGLDELPRILELGDGLLGMELALDGLRQIEVRIIPAYRSFSRFPAMERDLSLLVDLSQPYLELRDAMTGAVTAQAGTAFQGLSCVDVFRHKSLPEGRQAWLIRLRFQHPERTLNGAEVDGWVQAALSAAETLGAALRA